MSIFPYLFWNFAQKHNKMNALETCTFADKFQQKKTRKKRLAFTSLARKQYILHFNLKQKLS